MEPVSPQVDALSKDGQWLKSITIDGKSVKTRSGKLWNNLVTRTTGRHKDSCYLTVVNGFGNFQNFAEWCINQPNYMEVDENGYYWQLDKDILGNGDVYSQATCCFIPAKVNSFLIEQPSKLGLPKGVCFSKNKERYVSMGRELGGEKVYLGTFDSPETANNRYLAHKLEILNKLSEMYALPEHILSALCVKIKQLPC